MPWHIMVKNLMPTGLQPRALGKMPSMSWRNTKFHTYRRMNNTTERGRLLVDLNVRLRFMTKLYVPEHTMEATLGTGLGRPIS